MRQVILSVAMLSVFALGCGKDQPSGGPPGEPTTQGPTTPAGVSDLATAKPDVTMTAAAWVAEFREGKEAAKSKYAGKVIELSGVVLHMMEEFPMETMSLSLGAEHGYFLVNCRVDVASCWEKVVIGTEVTIRGKLSESGTIVNELMPATVVKVGRNPGEVMSAVDFAKRVQGGALTPKEGEEKKDRWLYVKGEVFSKDVLSDSSSRVVLKGDGNRNVICWVPKEAEQRVATLKLGQQITVLGELSAFSAGWRNLVLRDVMFR